jgi:hypothetical protein
MPEALSTIELSVTLLRRLAKERPAAFSEEFARSLPTLSPCFSVVARHEDAKLARRESAAFANRYSQLYMHMRASR